MLKCFASGGAGGGLRLSRNARLSDGEYNFPSYNPQQDSAVKKHLGLPSNFRGTVNVVDGTVTTSSAPTSRGRPTTQAQYYRQLYNRDIAMRPRGRGR